MILLTIIIQMQLKMKSEINNIESKIGLSGMEIPAVHAEWRLFKCKNVRQLLWKARHSKLNERMF